MRTSEYYAGEIHGFFVGWGLDAIEQHQGMDAVADRPDANLYRHHAHADDGYDFGGCTGCSCAMYAPCHHCENDHDDHGRNDAQDNEWIKEGSS